MIEVREDSDVPELMKIGHSSVSMTFMPDVVKSQSFTLCDCPGFLDNRGAAVNIGACYVPRREEPINS